MSQLLISSLLFSWIAGFAALRPKCALMSLENTLPEDLVNLLGGADTRYEMSNGATLPVIARPWGFNSYSPQSIVGIGNLDGWWFHASEHKFHGIRLTHQPSPWIHDYGNLLFKAYMPTNPTGMNPADYYSGYSPEKSIFRPYYFSTSLFAYGNTKGRLNVEFTPSRHGGIFRFTFPEYIAQEEGDVAGMQTLLTQVRRFCIELNSPKTDKISSGKSSIDGTAMLHGYTKHNSGGIGDDEYSQFAHYFVAMIYCGENGKENCEFNDDRDSHTDAYRGWIDFSPLNPKHRVLTVRFATSFISEEQALSNYLQEVHGKHFEMIKKEAQNEWNSVLTRVKVYNPPANLDECDQSDLLQVFYTCLYRASLFPRVLSEFEKDTGKEIHWSPYASNTTSRVQEGILVTDQGLWDAWHTIYPLLTLINRPQLANALNGWLSAYKESGWLPKWASPGHRAGMAAMMVGTMADTVFADAIVKNIPGFDVSLAYEAIRKNAFVTPPAEMEGVGRVCLDPYLQYGHIPRDAPSSQSSKACQQVISTTLNYLQSDFAIAQAAEKLHFVEDYSILMERAKNFTKIFDSATGFFRSKKLDDSSEFTTPFDQFAWGGDYTESGPWQNRFYLHYNITGLKDVLSSSGRDLCTELLKSQTMEYPIFHFGSTPSEFPMQTEFANNCWGQVSTN
jgi:predicted alpha-1,2-mannosidase